jgi:RNA polymerase sigma-70 factor (ECF subfamily)
VAANSQETQSCAYVKLEYTELRRIAAGYLRRDKPGITLQPTALVHEVFLRLVQSADLHFTDRTHFLAVAARSMRQILVDRARTNSAAKRDILAVPPSQWDSLFPPDNRRIIAIDEALKRLTELDSRQAEIVEMRFFAGMTAEEVAERLGISERTVMREWSTARIWLRRELRLSGL